MIEYKKSLINYNPIQSLKEEIELKYRMTRYKKLYKKYLYQCFEKHNFDLLYETIEDIIVE